MVNTSAIKKLLTERHLRQIFAALGTNVTPRIGQGGALIFPTRCHNGANDAASHKLYYYSNTCLFHCYTECSTSFDIFDLIIRAKGADGEQWSFSDALKLVMSVLDVELSDDFYIKEIADASDWQFLLDYKQVKNNQLIDLPEFNKNVLDVFSYGLNPWESKLIDRATLEKFKVGYYLPANKISIPHFDKKGRLIGLRGRALNPEDLSAGQKYMPMYIEKQMYSHPTSFNLYGIWENRIGIQQMDKAIIFEGEKSVLQMNGYFDKSNFALAICGMNISKYQIKLLLQTFPVGEVILAFDKEYDKLNSPKGKAHWDKINEIAKKFAPYVKTSAIFDDGDLLKYKDSPSDQGKEVFLKLFEDRCEIKTKIR